MADNTTVNPGSGGDTFRTLEDGSSIKWPTGVCCFATTVGTPDVLEIVRPAAGLPIAYNTAKDGSGTEYRAIVDSDGHQQVDVLSCASHAVTNAGTFAVQAAQSGSWSVTVSGTVTVGSHAVTNAGTFAVQVDGTALTRLTDIETNTDSGAVVGNGAAATAQRVTLANDSTGIVALTTSTASIGKLASNSGTDIGDVDVTSVIPGTGATNLGKAIDTATGATDTGILALATRTDSLDTLTPADGDNAQLRVNSSGALWVKHSGSLNITGNVGELNTSAAADGMANFTTAVRLSPLFGYNGTTWDRLRSDTTNGLDVDVTRVSGTVTIAGAVTNAGTFAVQESGGALTALQIIDDWDESDRCKTNPIVGQAGVAAGAGAVGATVQRVTLASDDPAVTALQILDNCISGNEAQVDVVAALPAGTNLIGKVSASHETTSIYDGTTALTPKFAVIDAATSGDNTIVSAVASKKIRVLSAWMVAAGAVNVRFESGASGTALTGQANLAANGGFVLPFNPVGWFETASNTLLNLELSGATSVDGSLTYVEV